MPVFARTKLVIHDDCLEVAPGSALPGRSYISLDYIGPNPQKIYYQLKKLFVTIFKIREDEIIEREFNWDRSKPEESLHTQLEYVKDMDKFSFLHIIVTLDAKIKPSEKFEKEGSAKIKIEGWLRTEYPQDTIWQRSLIYEMFRTFVHKVLYQEQRKRYKEECVSLINQLQAEIKEFLNILPKM